METKHYYDSFSMMEAGKTRSRHWKIGCQISSLLLVCRWLPSCCTFTKYHRGCKLSPPLLIRPPIQSQWTLFPHAIPFEALHFQILPCGGFRLSFNIKFCRCANAQLMALRSSYYCRSCTKADKIQV